MLIYVVRCGPSTADAHSNSMVPVAAIEAARLKKGGRRQARYAGSRLAVNYSISPRRVGVAASCLRNAQETASQMGFLGNQIVGRHVLDAVDNCGLGYEDLRALARRRNVPKVVLDKAQQILDNRPEEPVWVTHGWVIAGLTKLLGFERHYSHIVPGYCEIRMLSV